MKDKVDNMFDSFNEKGYFFSAEGTVVKLKHGGTRFINFQVFLNLEYLIEKENKYILKYCVEYVSTEYADSGYNTSYTLEESYESAEELFKFIKVLVNLNGEFHSHNFNLNWNN